MNATVIITTENRRENLAEMLTQTARPEVLAFDHGFTDGYWIYGCFKIRP